VGGIWLVAATSRLAFTNGNGRRSFNILAHGQVLVEVVLVLNWKSGLFVGNPRGGRTAAILASLTSTCRRHDIDPQIYLTQLRTNLPATLDGDLSVWLPDR
jgi:hypothetical protein